MTTGPGETGDHTGGEPTQPYAQQPPYAPAGPYGAYPPYGAPAGAAPYGVHPVRGVPYSDKTKLTAGLLQLLLPFVSVCGVGRLYVGRVGIGLTQLLGMFVALALSPVLIGLPFVAGIWLWSVIDGIVMLAGSPEDAQGRLLR